MAAGLKLSATHLWVSGAHARQHGGEHLPALVPGAHRHGQLQQVHQHTRVIWHQQTGELVQVLGLWAHHFTLALRVLRTHTHTHTHTHIYTQTYTVLPFVLFSPSINSFIISS